MFLHLNQEIRDVHGLLSLKGLFATFMLPEAYYAATLGDFVEHRHEIKPTEGWCFSSGRRMARREGTAIVIVSSAYYRSIESTNLSKEERLEELEKIAKEFMLNDSPDIETMEKNLPRLELALKELVAKENNGLLYDGSHSLPILVPKYLQGTINEGQRIYDAMLSYLPTFADLVKLVYCSDHGPSAMQNALDAVKVLERLGTIPLPSPA